MPAPALIALVSIAYLGLLFAIAFYADKRADAGRSVIASPYVYALSLGVYATSWTFYGSVGRAAANGVGFLPIYLGPTLAAALFWLVLRKIVRISRENRITSIADFIASRYGKSAALAGIVRHQTENLNLMGLFYNLNPSVTSNRLVNVTSRAGRSTEAWNAHQWDIKS